jgi:hypothetical protein
VLLRCARLAGAGDDDQMATNMNNAPAVVVVVELDVHFLPL